MSWCDWCLGVNIYSLVLNLIHWYLPTVPWIAVDGEFCLYALQTPRRQLAFHLEKGNVTITTHRLFKPLQDRWCTEDSIIGKSYPPITKWPYRILFKRINRYSRCFIRQRVICESKLSWWAPVVRVAKKKTEGRSKVRFSISCSK